MTVWFTSDTHWLHKNIIKYANRPWDNCDDMCADMIANWNRVVKKTDDIYHLGDVSLGSTGKTIEILQSLNGRKHLIWGNHDSGLRKKQAFISEFEWCRNYAELKIQDKNAPRGTQLLILCHYPLLTWNKAHHGSIMLHGHTHGCIDDANKSTRRLDVGVDSHNYTPISYKQVMGIMSERSYQLVGDEGSGSRK